MNKPLLTATLISASALIGTANTAHAVPDAPKAWEKCAGIAKAGKSDCALRDLAASDLRQSGLDYHPVLTSSDMANLYSAVESGLAVALLPESSITELLSNLVYDHQAALLSD